ncbi:3-phosphoshikimate 1-carboxyvinyltransferase [Pseudoramibacter alactolyticus]
MRQILKPHPICGEIVAPPSKSVSHRMVMAAALAKGESTVHHVLLSEDLKATCAAMEALGAHIESAAESRGLVTLTIRGCDRPKAAAGATIYCRESGSTLRFMLPLAGMHARDLHITGEGRLSERPLGPFRENFTAHGVQWTAPENRELPLTLNGCLQPGHFLLPGNLSSQFITGLLFALPLLDGDSTIDVITEMESAPYVAITLAVLGQAGIVVDVSADFRHYRIAGGQHYAPGAFTVEGDYSQAAFWLAMGVLSGPVTCRGLLFDSTQGDARVVDWMREMGGDITRTADGFCARPSRLRGIEMNVSQCPDLVPVLAVLATAASGASRIVGAGRLRLKESDRLAAMTTVLTALGADVKEKPEGLVIRGGRPLKGGRVSSFNDHRVAMALAAASTVCAAPVVLDGAEAVQKSYPQFWEDFVKMGGQLA